MRVRLITTSFAGALAVGSLLGAVGCSTNQEANPGELRGEEGQDTYALRETSPTTPPELDYLGRQQYSAEVNTIMDERWPVTRISMTADGKLVSVTIVGPDPAIPTEGTTHYWRSIIFGTNGRIVSAEPTGSSWEGCALTTITDPSTNPPTITYGCVPSQTDPRASSKVCLTRREWIEPYGWVWRCDCTTVN